MEFSKIFVPPYNPSPRLALPPKSKRTQKRKTAFFGTFLEGAKTDVFTSKAKRIRN